MPKANPAAPAAPQAKTHVIKMKTNRTPLGSFEGTSSSPEAVTPPAPVAAVTTSTEGLPPPPAQTSTEATETLSPQYVALARREKQLRKLQQDLKAEQDAWKAQQNSYISREALKSDPYKVLNEAGISYEQLTQLPTANQVDPIQAKIDELEAKITGFDKSQQERASNDYQQALKVIEGDVKLLVSADPAFETIKATGSEGEVVRLIEKVFQEEGTILDVEEASRLVEDKLLDRTFNQVKKLSELKKIQERLKPAKVEAKQETSAPGGKTLTNAMGVARQLTARERAILAFNNQLK